MRYVKMVQDTRMISNQTILTTVNAFNERLLILFDNVCAIIIAYINNYIINII